MTALLTALGAFVGVVGVSIAVWLQMVAPKRCPPRYVLGFFVFGTIFILLNTGAFGIPEPGPTAFALVGLLVALVCEIVGAVYVYRRFGLDETHSPLGYLLPTTERENP